MKRMFLFILFSVAFVTSHADKFQVLRVNTSSDILIDGKICTKGDIFSDASRVAWKRKYQAIEAVNLKTYDIVTFAVLENDKKTGRIKDYDVNKENQGKDSYYVKTHHLSTRAGISTLSDLSKYLQGTFYLMDTIYIESPVPLINTRYYYITYQQKGETVKKRLQSDENTVIIDRSLFGFAEKSCKELTVKMYFCSEIEDDNLLTESMVIKILPLQMK